MEDYLKQFGLFSEKEIDYFLSFGKDTTLSKGEYFIQEGEVAGRIGYIKSGLLRSFYYSSKSDEVTYCFSFPDELIAGYSSIITREATKENIQALTPCEVTVFPKRVLDDLVEKKESWLRFAKLIAEMHYVSLEERFFLLQKETALTRYQKLLENQAEYLQKIPLGYLASYLGVSQRHLSRLRKQISF